MKLKELFSSYCLTCWFIINTFVKENFKPKKIVQIDPAETIKRNSNTLNTVLLVGFIVFFGLFLLYTKFSKKDENAVEGYSMVYNLNGF